MKYFDIQDNKLFGYEDKTTKEFTVFNSDSKDVYEENLKIRPADWIYRTKQISYEYNELGHRSKSHNDVANEFILFTGCSFTEGVGLAKEDIYCHVAADKLNVDYYNLGLSSSGPDLIFHNLALWFTHIRRNPRAVVIQHTFPDRAYIPKNGGILPLGPWFQRIPNGMLESSERLRFESLIASEFANHYAKIMRDAFLAHMTSLNIPVIELGPDIETVDYARDIKHPGILSHQLLAEQVVQAAVANNIQ